MAGDEQNYIDGMLPFGLWSAPKINPVADAVEWCVSQEGVEHIFHHLDDFAPPDCEQCHLALHILMRVRAILGIPLAEDKEEGPTAVMRARHRHLKGELRPPTEKLQRLIELVTQWEKRKSSLIGTLHHASKVIYPVRSFLRRGIALLAGVKHRHHHIHLNMLIWRLFAAHWNGTALVVVERCM